MPDLTNTDLDQLIRAIGLRNPLGGRPAEPIHHGELRGARQHRRRGLPLCDPCRTAENTYHRERYAERKAHL